MFTIEDQKKLEYEMVQAGIDRWDEQKRKQTNKATESKSAHGRAIITATVDKVAEGVTEIVEAESSNRDIAKKKLSEMDPYQVAYLGLVTVVDGISHRYTLLKICRTVGMHVELQDRLDVWLQNEGIKAKRVIDDANKKTGFAAKRAGLIHKMNKDGYDFTEWENEERVHVGLRLIDKIIVKTGIVQLRTMREKNKTVTYLEPTEYTLEWIRNFHERNRSMSPRYAPCIIPPKDWEGVYGGGYYSQEINRLPLVRAH